MFRDSFYNSLPRHLQQFAYQGVEGLKLFRVGHVLSILSLTGALLALQPQVNLTGQERGTAERADNESSSNVSVTVNVPGSPQQSTQPSTETQYRDRDLTATETQVKIGWTNVWLNGILAVATLITALVAAYQANRSRLQAEQTRRTTILTQRPRVQVRNIAVDGFDSGTFGDRLYNARLWVINEGLTPATILRVHAQWRFDTFLPLENPVLNVVNADQDLFRLMPGEVMRVHPEDFPVDFPVHASLWNRADGIDDPKAPKLYLLGYVKYKDDLGILRRTFFCRWLDAKEHRFQPVDNPDYEYAE